MSLDLEKIKGVHTTANLQDVGHGRKAQIVIPSHLAIGLMRVTAESTAKTAQEIRDLQIRASTEVGGRE